MDIRALNMTFDNNILPLAGVIYSLFLLVQMVIFLVRSYFKSHHDDNPDLRPDIQISMVTLTKGLLLILGCVILFYDLKLKTASNFFYIMGMFFFLIYVLGELFIEIVMHAFLPLLASVNSLKFLPGLFFIEGEVSRQNMKVLFALINYSIIIGWLLLHLLG